MIKRTESNTKTANLQPHPLGAIFPPMSDEDYAVMVDGMKANGYDNHHPIILLDGMILDGNHRYTAAKQLKVAPSFKVFDGGDPFAFVIQENLGRRNLTPSQASMVAAELVDKMKEADDAAKAKAKESGEKPKKTTKGSKAAKAGKAVGVSERQVAAAIALKKKDPKAAEEVKSGSKSLHSAATDVEKKKTAEQVRSEEFADAQKRIDEQWGDGAALVAAKHLSSKEILQLATIEPGEMSRIKHLVLEGGWKLKAALGYKSVTLTLAHPIRAGIIRAVESGAQFVGEFEAYDKKWRVTFEPIQ